MLDKPNKKQEVLSIKARNVIDFLAIFVQTVSY